MRMISCRSSLAPIEPVFTPTTRCASGTLEALGEAWVGRWRCAAQLIDGLRRGVHRSVAVPTLSAFSAAYIVGGRATEALQGPSVTLRRSCKLEQLRIPPKAARRARTSLTTFGYLAICAGQLFARPLITKSEQNDCY